MISLGVAPRAVLCLGVLFAVAVPARAIFPPIFTTPTTVTTTPIVVIPTPPVTTTVPTTPSNPVTPVTTQGNPGGGGTVTTQGNPSSTPEPGSIVLGLIGLATVGAGTLRRRMSKN
jgi:hypothetical protein